MGLVKRILRLSHGADSWKAHAQSQKKECDDFGKNAKCGVRNFLCFGGASSSLEPFFEKHESTELNPKFRSG